MKAKTAPQHPDIKESVLNMIDTRIKLFNSLVIKDESPVLDFKLEWYWTKEDSKEKIEHGWGEFLKDFASLSNANSKHFNDKRYLIIGISNDKRKIGISITEHFFEKIKSGAAEKIEKFLSFTPQYTFEAIDTEDKKYILIEIHQPQSILYVKKEFKDKKGNLSKLFIYKNFFKNSR